MSDHIFIHSDLDDAGLSPAEFRVLAHLSRRSGKDGICHPGIRSIATSCCISKNTVGPVLESLENRRFIATSKRHGLLTEYALTIESGVPLLSQYRERLNVQLSQFRPGTVPK